MAEEKVPQNDLGTGKSNPSDPVKTEDVEQRSDNRMAMLSRSFIEHAPSNQGRLGSESANSGKSDQSKGNESSTPKEESTLTANSPKESDKNQKPDEVIPQTEKNANTPQKEQQPDESIEKMSKSEFKANWAKHQARADKEAQEKKALLEEKAAWEKERTDLLQHKQTVEEFSKDPVAFINSRMPELGKQIASSGDPVKIIESEVETYMTDLTAKFKKEYGEDWQYSDSESIKPGSASFRYKIALQDKIDQSRQNVAGMVSKRRQSAEDAQRKILKERDELKSELGFTDEDFKTADAFFQKEGVSYKNLVKLALIDKIISMKIDQVIHPSTASPDITQTRGGSSEESGEQKQKISDRGRQVMARLPIRQTL